MPLSPLLQQAYAVGTVPSGTRRITRFEAKWTVGTSPYSSSAFFSPWFGMDPSDNMNLIQPVNPWLGSNWNMYTEYYQWDNGYNSNSYGFDVNSGQTLHGALIYLPASDSYNLSQVSARVFEMFALLSLLSCLLLFLSCDRGRESARERERGKGRGRGRGERERKRGRTQRGTERGKGGAESGRGNRVGDRGSGERKGK